MLRALGGCWDSGGGGRGRCHCKCHLNAHGHNQLALPPGPDSGEKGGTRACSGRVTAGAQCLVGTCALLLCLLAAFSWGPQGPPPGFRLQEGTDVEGSLSGGAVGARGGLRGGGGRAGPLCGRGEACPVPEPPVCALLTCCWTQGTPPAGGLEAPRVEPGVHLRVVRVAPCPHRHGKGLASPVLSFPWGPGEACGRDPTGGWARRMPRPVCWQLEGTRDSPSPRTL